MKTAIASVLGALVFVICGCAATKPQSDMYIGLSENELICEMGMPLRHYSAGESKFLTYEFREHKVINDNQQSNMNGQAPRQGGTAPMVEDRYCLTTFEISGGRVVDWRANGNACSAN